MASLAVLNAFDTDPIFALTRIGDAQCFLMSYMGASLPFAGQRFFLRSGCKWFGNKKVDYSMVECQMTAPPVAFDLSDRWEKAKLVRAMAKVNSSFWTPLRVQAQIDDIFERKTGATTHSRYHHVLLVSFTVASLPPRGMAWVLRPTSLKRSFSRLRCEHVNREVNVISIRDLPTRSLSAKNWKIQRMAEMAKLEYLRPLDVVADKKEESKELPKAKAAPVVVAVPSLAHRVALMLAELNTFRLGPHKAVPKFESKGRSFVEKWGLSTIIRRGSNRRSSSDMINELQAEIEALIAP